VLDGEPWFVAADVCRVLGLDLAAGTTRHLGSVAADERRTIHRREVPELFSGTYAPSLAIINESGLYRLTMRSYKPEAHVFQDWVTREVLPTIRKTGSYSLAENKREA
jgi:prophage antirepressor-like protein